MAQVGAFQFYNSFLRFFFCVSSLVYITIKILFFTGRSISQSEVRVQCTLNGLDTRKICTRRSSNHVLHCIL